MKKTRLIVLLSIVALMLVSCTTGTADTADIAKQIEQVLSNTEKLESVSLDMDMTMDMSISGSSVGVQGAGDMPIKIKLKTSMDCINEPLATKMTMSYEPDFGTGDITMYMFEEGNTVSMYANILGEWAKETLPITEVESTDKYDAQAAMKLYLDSAKNFKFVGEENIDDRTALKIEGIIGKEALQDIMNSTGALDSIKQGMGNSSSDEDVNQALKLLETMGDLKVTLWIDKETMLPIRYSMDMTSMMQKMFESIAKDVIKINEVSVLMNIKSYNNLKPEDVAIPDEAKTAIETSGLLNA